MLRFSAMFCGGRTIPLSLGGAVLLDDQLLTIGWTSELL
jgi:hypothetical protein